MNKNIIPLAIAYSFLVNGDINKQHKIYLEKNNIDSLEFKKYIDKILNNELTVDEQDALGININQINSLRNNSQSNSQSKSNIKDKTMVLSNGNKRLDYDEAAFSDAFMLGFLIILFQVLFIVICYLLFI